MTREEIIAFLKRGHDPTKQSLYAELYFQAFGTIPKDCKCYSKNIWKNLKFHYKVE